MASARKHSATKNKLVSDALRDDKAIEAAVVRAVARVVRTARAKRKTTR